MDKLPIVHILKRESYLATIENSVGTNQYRSLFAEVDGVKKDILEDGNLSCALFASSILHQFGLISPAIAPHARTESTVRNMEASGWKKTDRVKPGVVLVWEEIEQEKHTVPHIGFAVGDDEAISNSWTKKSPQRHHITFGTKEDGSPARAITAMYTHPFLEA